MIDAALLHNMRVEGASAQTGEPPCFRPVCAGPYLIVQAFASWKGFLYSSCQGSLCGPTKAAGKQASTSQCRGVAGSQVCLACSKLVRVWGCGPAMTQTRVMPSMYPVLCSVRGHLEGDK